MAAQPDAQSLNQVFESHAVVRSQQALRRSQVLEAFSGYADADSFTQWHLCLYRFATIKPLTYVDDEAITKALAFFNQHPDVTLRGITALQRGLSHATFSLLRPGTSWHREEQLSLDSPAGMAEFESIWHPEYQRYCEHIFNHLVQVPLFVLGALRNRTHPALPVKLPNGVKQLQDEGLEALTRGYNRKVRNAISHGNTTFELLQIAYFDGNVPERFSASEFAELLDALVDTCHSILVAVLLFLCENQALVQNNGLDSLPLGLRFIFVDALASHDNLHLLSMVESTAMGNRQQLNVVCNINSRARWAQLFEGMHICWHASTWSGDRYSRFCVSLNCGMPVPANLFLDGRRLQQAINQNELLDDCAPEIIETSLLWYKGSALDKKTYTWKSLFAPRWGIFKRELVQDWRDRGLKVLSSRYAIRHVENRSTESVRRLNAHIVLRHTRGTITGEFLQEVIHHAIKRLRRHRVRKTDMKGERGRPGKPDYIWARLYVQDRRVRTLTSYGWRNQELLMIAEWSSPRKYDGAFMLTNPDIVEKSIRIQYNPNLVQRAEVGEVEPGADDSGA